LARDAHNGGLVLIGTFALMSGVAVIGLLRGGALNLAMYWTVS
jgi:hypothetical protein